MKLICVEPTLSQVAQCINCGAILSFLAKEIIIWNSDMLGSEYDDDHVVCLNCNEKVYISW